MVYIKVLCPYCGSDNVVLYGKNNNGKQRLLCRNTECSHKTFLLDYTNIACKPGVKQHIIDMLQNGSGTRNTA
jgi:transposase-like protein